MKRTLFALALSFGAAFAHAGALESLENFIRTERDDPLANTSSENT